MLSKRLLVSLEDLGRGWSSPLCGSGSAVCWQVVNDRPLGIWLPEIVDPEASFWIAHIATVFQVPVDDMAATIPLGFIFIAPTEGIADPTFYGCIAESASFLKPAV